MPQRSQTTATHPDATFDAVVAGGGIVGAAAALGLMARGDRMRWLRQARPVPPLPDGYAARVYALSPGNLAWLDTLGVTRHLDMKRIGSVRSMRISARHGSGLDLSAHQAGVAEMALIIESDNLLRALEAAVAAHGGADAGPGAAAISNIDGLCNGRPDECACCGKPGWLCATARSTETAKEQAAKKPDPSADRESARRAADHLSLDLDDGSALATRLLIAADGADSPLRTLAGIDSVARDYGHRAVVANFVCEKDHRGIACQWFDNGAVLAWLPLPGRHISMVWSLPQSRAEALLALGDAALTAQVAAAGEHRWGALTLVSPPQSFPLRRQRARRLTATRMALVGDAAHVVHPLAGQGMNLGLRDVRALLEATAGRRDPGSAHTLARYQALRQFDVHSIEAVTDSLFRMFGDPLATFVGGHGMGLLNHLAPLKSELVRQAMR